ncbi:predicted protein [Sclerotinia sclerotiorum 1980 UF-70]|uniref:Uncharacterized protein n=1 Tax=Sclerotinia sclerotiorum (strain ATCC 18683 / 1980 / Ss-1) TaxID=665079 RepID=A7F365_SCLS1|nr:predicted protein [Sclerotinia sclerotiorum 1980 UF-70]EDN97186.1 predicted protein [Sclerotinia sclerotiorum 1980 UF-70]
MSLWHEPGSIPAVPVYVGAATSITQNIAPLEQAVDNEKENGKSAMGWVAVVSDRIGLWLMEDSTWQWWRLIGLGS